MITGYDSFDAASKPLSQMKACFSPFYFFAARSFSKGVLQFYVSEKSF
jgi:hypothetical protein